MLRKMFLMSRIFSRLGPGIQFNLAWGGGPRYTYPMSIEEEIRALLAAAAPPAVEDPEDEFPEIEIVPTPPPSPRERRPPPAAAVARAEPPAPAAPHMPPPRPRFSEEALAELESSVRAGQRALARVNDALGALRAEAGWEGDAPRPRARPRQEVAAPLPPAPGYDHDERIPPSAARLFTRTSRAGAPAAPAARPAAPPAAPPPPDPRLMRPTDLITEEDPLPDEAYEGADDE